MSYRIACFATGASRWCCLWLLLAGFTASAAPSSNELVQQRERFPLVLEAAQHGPDDAWRKLAAGLDSYPLFPYLELAALQRKLDHAEPAVVRKYLDTWHDTLPAQTLREAFLLELARRGDWKNFAAFSTNTFHTKELQCDALKARLALGQALQFDTDVQPLWLSASTLPSACDDVFAWAREHEKLTPALLWQRVELAANSGNAALVANLSAMLEAAPRSAAEHIAQTLREPLAALNQAHDWPDSAHERTAAVLALEKLARHDSDSAQAQWTKLAEHFHFDSEQRNRVLRALALYPATSYQTGALARLEALPAAADDDTTREWQVRSAIAAQDWNAVLQAYERMSDTQKHDARWRYLRARALVKLDRKDEATSIFATIAQEANFHGFLAADWLEQPYTICSARLDAGDAQETAPDNAALTRAFEWFALDRLREARREWDFAMSQLDPAARRRAAAAASKLGWYDRAVYGLNQGDDLHLYELRFPLARRAEIERDAQNAGIDPSWAYAIIRAESAWTTDAHSGADAWGLMQLLPGTAKQLAKVEKVAFSTATDLFDPDLNIRLGTRYLADMALHYGGSPWLASAAYNAGADPVARWVDARDALEPDFFIETIPYKETREYVARVLAFSVIYDWRLHGSVQPLASRLPRVGQPYTPPPADAPRKAVVCPAQKTAVAAAPRADATTSGSSAR